MKEDEKVIVVKEWNDEMKAWEQTVEITRWEHNYETEEYIVNYKEK